MRSTAHSTDEAAAAGSAVERPAVEVLGCDAAGTVAFLLDRQAAEDRAAAEKMRAVCHFADLHRVGYVGAVHPDIAADLARRGPGVVEQVLGLEGELRLAGQGAFAVEEFAVCELAAALQMSEGAARAYLGQSVELRDRLPRLWEQVMAGVLPAWKGRQVAEQTIPLSAAAADHVDAQLAPFAAKVSLWRITKVVEAAVLRFDPELAAARAAAAAEHRGVWVEDHVDGTSAVHAVADTPDAAALDQALDAVASALGALGHTDPVQVRRAKALGVLADPQYALDLTATAETCRAGSPVPAAAGHTDGDPNVAQPGHPREGQAAHGPGQDSLGDRDTVLGAQAVAPPGAGTGISGSASAAGLPAALRRRPGSGPEFSVHLHLDSFTGLVSGRAGQAEAGPAGGEDDDPACQVGDAGAAGAAGPADTGGPTCHGGGVGGVARVERYGPRAVETVARWLAGLAPGAVVRLTPVVDLTERIAVDSYEIPDRLRRQVDQRDGCCMFPWCGRTGRFDLDHIDPYVPVDEGGPPGQTSTENLAKLCRFHHRVKTHGDWTYTRAPSGTLTWTSPLGRRYAVDETGTLPHG